jgi:uncharacterized membrane protein YjfL (UPF0719 family)
MEIMPVVQVVAASIAWTVLGILLLYFGVRLFDTIDPIDYRQAVREGNIAAGITVGAVILGISGIVMAIILTP